MSAKKGEVKAKKPATSEPGTGALAQKAMLVKMVIHRFREHKSDEEISDKVADEYQASKSMGHYKKLLIPHKLHQPVFQAQRALYDTHLWLTLPWEDGGWRLLSAAGYLEYCEKVKALKDALAKAYKETLVDKIEEIKDVAKKIVPNYREEDYPDKAEIQRRFWIDHWFRPVPSGKDFRVDVGNQELATLKASCEENAQENLKSAMKEPWERLAEKVQHLAERLNGYAVDPGTGKVTGKFHDSVIGNLVEVLDVLPCLNVTGDAALNKISGEIRAKLTAATPTVLRDDEKLRKSVAQEAEAILQKMQGYF